RPQLRPLPALRRPHVHRLRPGDPGLPLADVRPDGVKKCRVQRRGKPAGAVLLATHRDATMNDQGREPQDRVYQEAKAVLERLAHPLSTQSPIAPQPPTAPPAFKPESTPSSPASLAAIWQEQPLHQVVEFLPDAIVVIGAEGVILLVNHQ